jgi:hypothetical protein
MPAVPAWKNASFAYKTAVVANGETVSAAVNMEGYTPVGVILPTGMEGTSLGFTVSDSLAGTYVTMLDPDGAAVAYTVAAARYFPLDPGWFAGVQFLKMVVASQTGAATLTVVGRGI